MDLALLQQAVRQLRRFAQKILALLDQGKDGGSLQSARKPIRRQQTPDGVSWREGRVEIRRIRHVGNSVVVAGVEQPALGEREQRTTDQDTSGGHLDIRRRGSNDLRRRRRRERYTRRIGRLI